MRALRMVVHGDKLIGEAPPGLPEGTVLDLCLAEPDDSMSADEVRRLNDVLESSWRSAAGGVSHSTAEMLTKLEAKRR